MSQIIVQNGQQFNCTTINADSIDGVYPRLLTVRFANNQELQAFAAFVNNATVEQLRGMRVRDTFGNQQIERGGFTRVVRNDVNTREFILYME